MTDITIPPEVEEAGARAIADAKGWTWERIPERLKVCCRAEARAAFLAMINAWPEGWTYVRGTNTNIPFDTSLILPLTEKELPQEEAALLYGNLTDLYVTEKTDDKA